MNEVRQTLFFSATFDNKIKALASYDAVAKWNSSYAKKQHCGHGYPDGLSVDKSRKSELLAYLIGSRTGSKCWSSLKLNRAPDALVKELKLDGIKAASMWW